MKTSELVEKHEELLKPRGDCWFISSGYDVSPTVLYEMFQYNRFKFAKKLCDWTLEQSGRAACSLKSLDLHLNVQHKTEEIIYPTNLLCFDIVQTLSQPCRLRGLCIDLDEYNVDD